jgi:hypothetical protein
MSGLHLLANVSSMPVLPPTCAQSGCHAAVFGGSEVNLAAARRYLLDEKDKIKSEQVILCASQDCIVAPCMPNVWASRVHDCRDNR